jgi:hypothetical protein
MSALQRTSLWIGAIAAVALVSFVLVLHGSVRTLKTTVREHTATLNKPMLAAAVFPGVPAAFTDRWHTATQGKALTLQDHLWLTLHITNTGHSQVRNIAANLVLVPAISAIYPGSGASVGTPAALAEHMGQTQARCTFLSLAPGNAHTGFIALRPDGLDGPPYAMQAQRQWVAQHRASWKQCPVTAEEHTTFVQYGFAPPLRARQAASGPAGTSAPPRILQSAAQRTP